MFGENHRYFENVAAGTYKRTRAITHQRVHFGHKPFYVRVIVAGNYGVFHALETN